MLKVTVALCAALCLGACASDYVGKPYDRTANADLHTMGLPGDTMPKQVIAYEVASVGRNFGLIGALVDAGIQSSRQNDVNKALADDHFDAAAKLQARLVSALDTEGYKVKPIDLGTRPARDFLTSYGPPTQAVDAYLDVIVINYGYLSAGASKPFRPTMAAKVRLVSAKDTSKVLMENIIIYNAFGSNGGAITISPSPTYVFNNRAELLADPKRLEGGLEDAIDQVADTAARLLH